MKELWLIGFLNGMVHGVANEKKNKLKKKQDATRASNGV
jgi:hypothetical protein